MVLLLATHVVETPTARVPLSIIILNDAVKRKTLPPTLKCRVVIPSAGQYSCSLWDAASVEDLQAWVSENLEQDGVTSIAEVPEDFTLGLSLELTTARAADKVAAGSKSTLERINTTRVKVMEAASAGIDRLDSRTNFFTASREAASAAAAKVRAATESEGVARSLASISSGLQTASTSMSRAVTWVGSKVRENLPPAAAASALSASGSPPPPSYDAAAAAYPDAAFVPLSTHAAGQGGAEGGELGDEGLGGWGAGPAAAAQAPAQAAEAAPTFTLQDDAPTPAATPAKSGPHQPQGGGGGEEDKENVPLSAAGGGERALPTSAHAN